MLLCCFLCSVSVKEDCKLAKFIEGVSQQWSCGLVVHLCESNLSDNHSNVMSFLLLVLSYQKLWQRRCAGAPRRTFWARPRATLTSLLHFMTLLLVETTHSASPKVNPSLNLEGENWITSLDGSYFLTNPITATTSGFTKTSFFLCIIAKHCCLVTTERLSFFSTSLIIIPTPF